MGEYGLNGTNAVIGPKNLNSKGPEQVWTELSARRDHRKTDHERPEAGMSPMYPAPTYPGVPRSPATSAGRVDALALLRGSLTPSGNANWIDMLRSGLRQLRADLHEHIAATEGPDGLYDEVGRTDPRLACTATRLRREHTRLSAIVDELSAGASHDPPDATWLKTARPRIRDLVKQWGGHRRRDNQLAYDALSLDIGGQD